MPFILQNTVCHASESKQTKAINSASVEGTKVRRRELQNVRKIMKSGQRVGADMIKQRVENTC